MSATADSILILGAPFLSALLVLPLARVWSATAVWTAVMTLGAAGHHLPGFLRTYGDRALYRRYRLRFLLAPPLLFGASLLFSLRDLHGLALYSLVWSIWHGMMQHYGFMRIYDAKRPPTRVQTANRIALPWARLDWALTCAWFFLCLLWGPGQSASVLNGLLESGFWAMQPVLVSVLQTSAAVVCGIVTVVYVVALFIARRRGEAVSGIKLALALTTTGFVYFARVATTNAMLSAALFEVLHDVQYLTVVWAFNRRLVSNGTSGNGNSGGRWTRFLFGPRKVGTVAYLALCLGYGGLAFGTGQMGEGLVSKILLAALATSGMLHFYYDGFIWKVREAATRDGLGLQPSPGNETKPANAASQRAQGSLLGWLLTGPGHALRLVLPLGTLLVLETWFPNPDSIVNAQRMAALVPRSATVQNNLGAELLHAGRTEEAIAPLKEAVRLEDGLMQAHELLGQALSATGRTSEALVEFTAALKLYSSSATTQLNTGIALDAVGRSEEAIPHFVEATRIQPNLVEAWVNLGGVLGKTGRYAEAVIALRRAVALAPDYLPAQHNLAVVEALLKH